MAGRYRVHWRTHEDASAAVRRATKSDFGSKHFNTTVKNSHAAAIKTVAVETLVQMINVQKYALFPLNDVAANVSDSSTLAAL
jgi:hypothetical protein